jgi:hypothetical protein
LVVGTFAVVAVIVAGYLGGWLHVPGSAPTRFGDAYVRPPKLLLVDDEIQFGPLDTAQLSKVRVTPSEAVRVANSEYGRQPGSRVTFESLGGYVDANDIVHDWVGTRSWVPKAQPAYLVRISGVQIPMDGPIGGIAKNRSWNVLVNALNGRVISAMTYN